MYFKPATIVGIAAILSMTSAAPIVRDGGCDAAVDNLCYSRRSIAPPTTAVIIRLPIVTPVDDVGYLKRSIDEDFGNTIVIGSKKRSPDPEPMWPEGTCGPEEDLACYPDGSNGKRSPEEPEDVGAYDEDDGVPFPSKRSPNPEPMWPEGTCGPEEDLACYPDGSNGKRSESEDIQPQPMPPGKAKEKRSPEPEPEPMWPEHTCGPEEDLACYPDGSNGKRALTLDPEGARIITGDNYPGKRVPKQPIDGDYPIPNDDSYPVKAKRAPLPHEPVDQGDYAPPDDPLALAAKAKRMPMRPIDGDYPQPNDDSYPVRREPGPLLDAGIYPLPDKN